MKKYILTAILWMAIILQASQTLAQPANPEPVIEKKYTFINNTGRATNDLHIEFEGTVSLLPDENGIHARYPNKSTIPEDGETKADFSGRGDIVPNGSHISGTFASNAEFSIKTWWWTYNGERVGDEQDGNSAMLISPGQVVTELEFENHIEEGRQGRTQPVVNDLHIVVDKKPEVINLDKQNEDDESKAGGVFRDQEVVTCECPPAPANNAERVARNREVRQMPQPCREICKDRFETCYVVHLRNPVNKLEPGTSVRLRLRSDDDIEVSNWWWTEDGKPLFNFHTDRSGRQRVTRGGTNAPPGNYDNPGGTMRGPRIVDYSQISAPAGSGDSRSSFILPEKSTAQTSFSIGVSAGLIPGRTASADGTVFPGIESLNEKFLNNGGSWQEVMEALGGEWMFGDLFGMRPTQDIYIDRTIDLGISLGVNLTPSLEIHAAVSRASFSLNSEVPVTVFPFSGEDYRVDNVTMSANINQTRFMAGAAYTLPTGKISPFAGGGLAMSIQHASDVTLMISDITMDTPAGNTYSGNLHAYAFGGINTRLSDAVSAELKLNMMLQWGETQNLVDIKRPFLSGTVKYYIQP